MAWVLAAVSFLLTIVSWRVLERSEQAVVEQELELLAQGLPEALLLGGILLAAGLFVATRSAVRYRALAASHEAANRALEQENRERREAEERFRRLVELGPDATVIVDTEGIIRLVNEQARSLFGYSDDEILGRRVETLIPEPLAAGHVELRRHYVEDPVARPMAQGRNLTARTRDGVEVPVEISLSPLPTAEGLQVVAAVRDVTAQREAFRELSRLNQELERSNRDLEQFAYSASHDLQEPLRAVAGCLSLLREEHGDRLEGPAEELLGHAVDGARRMKALVQALLGYSRVTTRAGEIERVDCRAAVEEVLADLAVAREECGAEIVVPEMVDSVRADPTQFRLVLRNLISNALKFREEGRAPRIEIRGVHRAEGCLFSVRDDGIGIPPEHRERVFEIFKRLHSRTVYPGTGIGLALCRRVVERHGGTIWVDGASKGDTLVKFILPQDSPGTEVPAEGRVEEGETEG